MAFCSNCGTELQEGTAFCASCGTAVGTSPQQQTSNVASSTPKANKKSNPDMMLKIISGILIVAAFLPSFNLTGWSGINKSYSAFGNILAPDASAFPSLVAALIPVALLLFLIFAGKLSFLRGKHRLVAALMCALGIFFNIRFMAVINSVVGRSTTLKAGLGFFVTILLYLVAIVISLRSSRASKDK
ncbi:MAG: zinc-ribbon domain-containing protein [Clostridiales bacterium]|nr:zinc-ribbon domain-containing protein [Clostridiales bacterium]